MVFPRRRRRDRAFNPAGDVLRFDISTIDLDGGSGTDTLRFSGSGQSLDLPIVPNDVIAGIEIIDLTGTGDNSLTLDFNEVHILSSTASTERRRFGVRNRRRDALDGRGRRGDRSAHVLSTCAGFIHIADRH